MNKILYFAEFFVFIILITIGYKMGLEIYEKLIREKLISILNPIKCMIIGHDKQDYTGINNKNERIKGSFCNRCSKEL